MMVRARGTTLAVLKTGEDKIEKTQMDFVERKLPSFAIAWSPVNNYRSHIGLTLVKSGREKFRCL
jgi:hypothetical protein